MVAGLGGCAGPPPTALGIVERLEAAEVLDCDDRREPVPDVITCEDPAGDVTIGVVDDPVGRVAATAGTLAGPWVVGDGFVVLTDDGTAGRVERIVEALGEGTAYTVDDAGTPAPLEG